MNAAANPFRQICYTLMRPSAAPAREAPAQQNSSRTECIRAVLRQAGRPMSAAEILVVTGDLLPYGDYLRSTSLVRALLKWDIRQGRVRFEDGRYSWNSDAEAAEAAEVRAALRLLRRHGFVCTQGAV